MIDASVNDGDLVFCAEALSGIDGRAETYSSLPELCGRLSGDTETLVWTGAFPCITRDTVLKLQTGGSGSVLAKGNVTAAFYVRAKDLSKGVPQGGRRVEIPEGQWLSPDTAENAYAVQELMRRRINLSFMKKGVFFVDPMTTHISPLAEIGEGTRLLPGCLIYGKTVIGKKCVVGPNSMLTDAVIGDGTSVDASQLNKCSVGSSTTVGPFAYIRPDTKVGDGCRIGDFVELKNSNVGDGTKVSHLTYIGDSDLGENINVGCGVVTVNYDGKYKYRTTVKDHAFIGCNVNLVAPVTVGEGSFIAAGSTITRDVPQDSLAVARERQKDIEGWAKKRRDAGKLK